jgi:NADPH-dependent 2,4-dienoyl-CoA reductase/sulfur reductase-like enzyme
VENARLPLLRVLGPEVAQVFADLHRDHGVDLRLETTIEEIDHRSGKTTVVLSDGHRAGPDLVVVAIGAAPADGLAASAGLPTDGGVLVDARLRTADPHVYAVGDVANHDHPGLGRRVRVEHWDNAIHQGRHAARVMLGSDEPYHRLPYFFTDQYDLGMEYVGHVGPEGYDEVVVRSRDDGAVLSALWIHDDRVVAGMHANDWDAIDPIRQLVGTEATPAVRDPAVALADLAGQG